MKQNRPALKNKFVYSPNKTLAEPNGPRHCPHVRPEHADEASWGNRSQQWLKMGLEFKGKQPVIPSQEVRSNRGSNYVIRLKVNVKTWNKDLMIPLSSTLKVLNNFTYY